MAVATRRPRGTPIARRRVFLPAVRRNDPSVEPAKWLRLLVNDLDWGSREFDDLDQASVPKHCNTNAVIEAFLSRKPAYPQRLSLKLLKSHFDGHETLYFTGASGRYTLLMLDIDCHRSGTLAEALRFADYLKSRYFPDLYHEVSTNGNGVHGYVVIDKAGVDNADYNRAALDLGKWLRRVLASTAYDVETIECKGTAPVVRWGRSRGHLREYVAGVLAKLPRDSARYAEWTRTTLLSVAQVRELMDGNPVEIGSDSTRLSSVNSSGSEATDWTQFKAKIEGLMPLATRLVPLRTKISEKYRTTVSCGEVATFLALLSWFDEHPNKDESMPQKRFMAAWQQLYAQGVVDHQFNNRVFAWVRNLCSDKGLIEWVDKTCATGQACKWKASQELRRLTDTNSQYQGDLCGNIRPCLDVVPAVRPVRRVETLLEVSFPDLDEALVRAGLGFMAA